MCEGERALCWQTSRKSRRRRQSTAISMHLSQLLPSVALSLHPYYNNKATSLSGQSVHGGFDGVGATYPIDCLPTGSFEHNSVKVRSFDRSIGEALL